MLLVVETREDLVPVPPESTPRSTERALAHMGWPFPVDNTTPIPRRNWPVKTATPARIATPDPRHLSRPLPALAPETMFAFEPA